MEDAPLEGQRDLTGVLVIQNLCRAYEARKGIPAPNSLNETAPFFLLAKEVFDLLGGGSPRAAMQSLNVCAKNPKLRIPYSSKFRAKPKKRS